MQRQCTKTGCSGPAVATLTYVYRDQTAVLGPLATYAEPHTYDLCVEHASGLTAPRGWEVVRLVADDDLPCAPADDLLAIADALRETPAAAAARTAGATPSVPPDPHSATRSHPGARGHLRLVRD